MADEQENKSKEIALTRVFDFPREVVWEAWTDPDGISNWWGPNGFTTTTKSMDLRPGGKWIHVMHGPDGVDYPNFTEYIEVDPPNRLVYRNSGGEGELADVSFISTVEFRDIDGKTELSLTTVMDSAEMLELVVKKYGAIEGLENTFSRLADYLDRK
ncbi:SRPBCC family protein [Leptolyngbya sp. 7M]|uniref:SRPBCC family protein n=1 Tax=Leptolyngbya sp. 7M TaxID=2812896 RepID=UPI001B8B074A|nr:SRPBCC family protein [Leptolyngbya sp. 7M]QYO66805.1 SRPBCC family protein [Leptolyngbya sp. 7M]QYU68275.1 SRPBCC family protein [Leptolyngbya sp. 15MV]